MSGKTPQDRQVIKRIGRNIRLLRSNLGITQEGLAANIGVKRDAVVDWETGKNMPSPYYLVKLVEELKTNWGTLFYGVGGASRGEK